MAKNYDTSPSDNEYEEEMTYSPDERMQTWCRLREEMAARVEAQRLADLALFERISEARMR